MKFRHFGSGYGKAAKEYAAFVSTMDEKTGEVIQKLEELRGMGKYFNRIMDIPGKSAFFMEGEMQDNTAGQNFVCLKRD